jgi:basic amino acid/polyamine antiporter, APA family
VTVTIDKATGENKFGNLYSQLLEYIIPTDLAFYALMVGAVILLRVRAPQVDRPYRTFGYPVPAIIYLVIAVFLVVDFVWLAPETSGIGSLIVLAGIPVYYVWSRTDAIRPGSRP